MCPPPRAAGPPRQQPPAGPSPQQPPAGPSPQQPPAGPSPQQPPSNPPPVPLQQQQQQPPPYPYYYPPPHHRRSKSSSNFASCLLATGFLAIIIVGASITCFILFRPQDPEIAVNSMKLPVFTLHNGTANFTFFQYVAVRNPNRFSFSHYDSSLQLLSASTGPVGFMYIPAGQIAGGRTQYMTATFDVRSFPIPPEAAAAQNVAVGPLSGPGPMMELESRMKLVGTVKVMKVFAHHVEKGATCRVSIQVSDGTVLAYHC